MIGAGGVERIVEIELDAAERAAFDKSVAAVRRLRCVEALARELGSAAGASPGRGTAMNIHEYQAKELLAEYGVAGARTARVAYTPEEAERRRAELGGPVWVVKAQIHAGGRGKGGGVKLAPLASRRSRQRRRRHARA